MRIIEMRRTCCGVPVWMLDTTCWSNSRLSGTEKLRSASMLLASDPAHSRWLIHERVPQAASALKSQVLDTHRALGKAAGDSGAALRCASKKLGGPVYPALSTHVPASQPDSHTRGEEGRPTNEQFTC